MLKSCCLIKFGLETYSFSSFSPLACGVISLTSIMTSNLGVFISTRALVNALLCGSTKLLKLSTRSCNYRFIISPFWLHSDSPHIDLLLLVNELNQSEVGILMKVDAVGWIGIVKYIAYLKVDDLTSYCSHYCNN